MTLPAFPEVTEPEKRCENCKWWNETHETGYGNCKEGIHNPDDIGCIYWEAKGD